MATVRPNLKKESPSAGVRRSGPLLLLYYAWRDQRTPWYAKLAAMIAAGYVISPIDLVPDFIPVAGYLDDLVVAPLLLSLATKLLPMPVRQVAAQRAASFSRWFRWALIAGAIVVVVLLVLIVRALLSPH